MLDALVGMESGPVQVDGDLPEMLTGLPTSWSDPDLRGTLQYIRRIRDVVVPNEFQVVDRSFWPFIFPEAPRQRVDLDS